MLQDKYLNLFTDFGFKRIFGQEQSKETLIAFLNTLLPPRHQIEDLQYTNPEHQGLTEYDRKAIFDLNCVSSTGEHFIVELQKAKQKFFKDRSVFYASFPIQRQAQRGTAAGQLATLSRQAAGRPLGQCLPVPEPGPARRGRRAVAGR